MIEFSQPAYFILFSTLAIIVVIHLLNRREPKSIKVGSVDLFVHSESLKIKRIKFSEFLLFLLRSLIFSLLILLLVEPMIERSLSSEGRKWILLEPGMEAETIQADIDALTDRDFELRYLEHNFPEEQSEQANKLNYWSLLNEINSIEDRPDTVIVFSSSKLTQFRLDKPEINYQLIWQHQPERSLKNQMIAKANDKMIRHRSDETISSFETVAQEANANVPELNAVKVAIYYENSFREDLRYLQAALKAIDQSLIQTVEIETKPINSNLSFSDANLHIVLSKIKLGFDAAGKRLIFTVNTSDQLITKSSDHYNLNRRLIPSQNPDIFSDDLVQGLIKLLPTIDQELLDANDQRIISSSQLNLKQDKASQTQQASFQDINQILWTLLLLSIAFERFYSWRRQS